MSNCFICNWKTCNCGGAWWKCSCPNKWTSWKLTRALSSLWVPRSQIVFGSQHELVQEVIAYSKEKRPNGMVDVATVIKDFSPKKQPTKEKQVNLNCAYEWAMWNAKCIHCDKPKRRRDQFPGECSALINKSIAK